MSPTSTARSKLLIVDCCVIIEAYRLQLWHAIVSQGRVAVPETVVNETIQVAREFDEFTVDIEAQASQGKIQVPSLNASDLKIVRQRCGPKFIGAVHDGEQECLAVLLAVADSILCSSDAVVFRYLGWIQQPDRGISLEEVVESFGIAKGKGMQWKLTKAFRDKYTQQGFAEAIQSGAIRL
jgi:hypothetical protein